MLLRSTILFLSLWIPVLQAQDMHWIFLETQPTGDPVELTTRAQERLDLRGKTHATGDFQIPATTLDLIRNSGARIRHASRFLNAVSVQTNSLEQLESIRALSLVTHTRPLATRSAPRADSGMPPESLTKPSSFDYGLSLQQNEMLEIPAIHDLGYTGSGVLIAVFDAGFNPVHSVFDDLDVVAQYDFVDQEIDPAGVGHEHGNNVLSALAGYAPGHLIGPAYGASYLLARTENDIGESTAEEDNWVAALEWADSLGADIVSSSVNYREFDNSSDNYPYAAMDGATAVTTVAANIASERGILMVNAVANEGPSSGSLWPPADSPHVLAVGAISASGTVQNFSSRGPTSDGRIKPDVVALGSNVFVATSIANYALVNGTSFSTPLVAGLAALLLEAHPEMTPDAVINLFRETGDQASAPNNDHGYGVPRLSSRFSRKATEERLLVFPNPLQNDRINLRLQESISGPLEMATLFDIQGRRVGNFPIQQVSETELYLDLSSLSASANQIYFISILSQGKRYSAKFIYIKS